MRGNAEGRMALLKVCVYACICVCVYAYDEVWLKV